jgi:hypothetical protein
MPRDYQRRIAMIRKADQLLQAAGEAARARDVPGALRAVAAAGDHYRRAGLIGMVERTEAIIGGSLGCSRKGLPWTPRMVDLALEVEALTTAAGRPPTWHELAHALGVNVVTARDLAHTAKARGLVTWEVGQPRTLRVNRMEARR